MLKAVHVAPVGDLKEHVIDADGGCPCIPRRDSETVRKGGCPLFVHHAFDDRDKVEQAESILNGQATGAPGSWGVFRFAE